MARSLLAASSFFTLVGLCPALIAPVLVTAVATARTGNARTPSYDDGMVEAKSAEDPWGVVLVAEPVAPAPVFGPSPAPPQADPDAVALVEREPAG
jgi:hypothetical protein